jgi:hypothetical protein
MKANLKYLKTIATPNTGSASLVNDWKRVLHTETSIRVNGKALSTIAKNYNNFKSEQDIVCFIKNEILKDLEGDDEKKSKALDYTKKTLHQGGLLYPVASSISTSLNSNDDLSCIIESKSRKQEIHFETSKNGFKVFENIKIYKCFIPSADKSVRIIENEDESPVLEAEGAVDVDFSKSPNKPCLSSDKAKQKVHFYHPILKHFFDIDESAKHFSNLYGPLIKAGKNKLKELINKVGIPNLKCHLLVFHVLSQLDIEENKKEQYIAMAGRQDILGEKFRKAVAHVETTCNRLKSRIASHPEKSKAFEEIEKRYRSEVYHAVYQRLEHVNEANSGQAFENNMKAAEKKVDEVVDIDRHPWLRTFLKLVSNALSFLLLGLPNAIKYSQTGHFLFFDQPQSVYDIEDIHKQLFNIVAPAG